jgi:NADPH2:quinone reductase
MIGQLGGSKADVDTSEILFRRLSITGSTLRARPTAYKAKLLSEIESVVWPLVANAKVRPIVYKTFPLTEASSAHALMETSQHIGKLILTCEGP